MIKANELRLGNYVLENGEPSNIYMIDRGGISFYRINDIPVNKETGCTLNGGEDRFKPIPLTPDWLDRCGLIKNKYGNIELAPQFLLKENILKDEFGITEGYIIQPMGWHGAVSKPIIKHLHQLQNLYLDLTGEELNVKL